MRRECPTLLLVVLVFLFFVGGVVPGSVKDKVRPWFPFVQLENLSHFLLSLCVAFFLCFLIQKSHVAFLIAVAFGGVIELAQVFVPGRTASWSDFLLDFTGCLMGVCLFWLRNKVKEAR